MSQLPPRFSVVTPSYNMLEYLKRCAHSVADQPQSVEHIVVDGGSRDGTPEWLASQKGLRGIVERDGGMYDAVNKGLSRARGEFVSYLNCDEQYLEGTLDAVARYFDVHPAIDMVFGDALVVDPAGRLLAFRKGYTARWPYIAVSHLYNLSCTMFLRRSIIDDGARFDMSWKDVGDAEFVVRLLRSGVRAARIPRYLASFTLTGSNMSAGANARAETKRLRDAMPRWVRALAIPIEILRRTEKLASRAYVQRFPLEYAIYSSGDAVQRQSFVIARSTSRWPSA